MKLNFDQSINDLNGNQLSDGEIPITLSLVAINALLKEDGAGDKTKFFRWIIAKKINNNDELSIEEIAEIKKSISHMPTLVMGRCWDLLEGGE